MMYSNEKVTLEKLTLEDAGFFYALYAHPEVTANFGTSPFLENETPVQFTDRIIAQCDHLFTIRISTRPGLIIGECALHDWDRQKKQIAIGGSLLPKYWGNGYMQAALELLIEIAKEELGVKVVLGRTKITNKNAIRLVEKIGFEKYREDEQDIVMRKEI